MSAMSKEELANPFGSTKPGLLTLIEYSPGSSARIAQPSADVSADTVIGPVTCTRAPSTGRAGLVTWTIRAVPAGGEIRPDSTTGLPLPSAGQVTLETVWM